MPGKKPVAVLITAAGLSIRFSQSLQSHAKKEFHLIDGNPVLLHNALNFIQALRESPYSLEYLVITCTPGKKEETASLFTALADFPADRLLFTEGGATRRASVLLGLEALSALGKRIELAAIQDGSRPWTSEKLILETFSSADFYGGAAPAVALTDALKRIDKEGCIAEHHNRDHFVGIQTPQIFRFTEILEAHRDAERLKVSCHDDTELFTRMGGRVKTVPGERTNIKITYYSDLASHPRRP